MAQAQLKSKPITAAQVKRIHTILHVLGISDENYRAALDSRFNVTTCKDLTVQEAKNFIDEMEKLARKTDREHYQTKMNKAAEEFAGKQPKRFDDLDNRPGMASAAQLRKIEAGWQGVSIIPEAAPRAKALRRFIQRIAAVADIRFLDAEMAGKVINAINAMQKR
jgi:phage gp16-like protein